MLIMSNTEEQFPKPFDRTGEMIQLVRDSVEEHNITLPTMLGSAMVFKDPQQQPKETFETFEAANGPHMTRVEFEEVLMESDRIDLLKTPIDVDDD